MGLYGNQITKGSDMPYHLMPKVHCLAIIKTKAPEFSDTELYHHYHTYQMQHHRSWLCHIGAWPIYRKLR